MKKNKIDYEVKLTYDEKRNSIIYMSKKITLYDACNSDVKSYT